MPIALDATYSAGSQLTGVGVYCQETLWGLAASHPEQKFLWFYRPHRLLRSLQTSVPGNCGRRLLLDAWPARADLFHGLNQRLPKWRPSRAVTTFHDLFVMSGEYSSPEFRERFAQQAREAARSSDRIITVSHFTANQVHQLLHVERERLRVVHHGVKIPKPRAAEPPKERIVLHVGAIQTRKNIRRLIEAFRILPKDWKLVLAGSAGYGAEQELARADDRVRITGFVDEDQLDDLYRRASIFVFPSLDEGFGMPVLEAMAYQVPVIASNVSALPEVCGDAAILIDPLNSDQIAAELKRLSMDPELSKKLQQLGLERAAHFTWDKAARQTWDVYCELM